MPYSRRAGDPPEGSWLPKSALVAGTYYAGKCRNAQFAQWDGTKFVYVRHKFGFSFPEEIEHPEDDRGFDVFFPKRAVELADVPTDARVALN